MQHYEQLYRWYFQCGTIVACSSAAVFPVFVVFSYATVQRRDRWHVCPSVCLSHAGIDSKLMTIGSCSFHHRVSQGLYFHLEASNETAKITAATNVQFSDCCCQELSQTRSLAVAERPPAWHFVSLNILLSHSRSFAVTQLSRACVSPY